MFYTRFWQPECTKRQEGARARKSIHNLWLFPSFFFFFVQIKMGSNKVLAFNIVYSFTYLIDHLDIFFNKKKNYNHKIIYFLSFTIKQNLFTIKLFFINFNEWYFSKNIFFKKIISFFSSKNCLRNFRLKVWVLIFHKM